MKTAVPEESAAPGAEPTCFGLKLLGTIERPLGPLLGRLAGLPAPDFIGHRLLAPVDSWERLGLRLHGTEVRLKARVFEATLGVEVLDPNRLFGSARQAHRRLWPGVPWEPASLADAAFRVLINARVPGLSVDSYWTEPVELPWRGLPPSGSAPAIEARTELLIRAPAQAVWAALFPLLRWPEWNTDFRAVVARRELGEQEFECHIAGLVCAASVADYSALRFMSWTLSFLGVRLSQRWELVRQGQFVLVRVHGCERTSLLARIVSWPVQFLLDQVAARWLQALKRHAENAHGRQALATVPPNLY